MKKILSLALLALLLFAPAAFAEERCCWIDTKTGKQVRTAPASGINFLGGSTSTGVPQISEIDGGRTAHDPVTGRNYHRDANGCWINSKTGKAVRTAPASGINFLGGSISTGVPQVSEIDGGRTAYDPVTGRNYARVPCPPTKTTTSPTPPTEHALRTQPDLFEFGLGYSYINAPDEEEVKDLHGFNASLFVNVNSWLAFGGEFMGGFGDTTHRIGIEDIDVSLNRYVYVFGPRISVRPTERFRIFAQGLFGGVHDNTEVSISGPGGFSTSSSTSADSWAFDFGVGADWRFANHWSWRIIQADYLATTFSSPQNNNWQDNWRLSTGIVFSFGGRESPRPIDYSGKEPPISTK